MYSVDYFADYNLDGILEEGVDSVESLVDFLSDELFFGFPIETNENLFGCTAFVAHTPDGKQVVGRNFDYAKSGALLVHTQPSKGYESYSMITLSHIGVAEETNTMPDTFMGKFSILAAPYACVDGMNEKGLSVSVLELETEPTIQDNGKTDIITTVAVRMLLDRCATTEEAITELGKYDMFSSAGMPYHLLITDADNRTVVVEWLEQEMVVLEESLATNFQLAKGKDYGVGIGQDRYEIAKKRLDEKNGILTEEETMKLLEDAKVTWNGEWGTEWSVVYNVDDFSVMICNDMDYENVYRFASSKTKN